MTSIEQVSSSQFAGRRHFATTRWSVVLAAGGGVAGESRAALETLCETYWYPLYAFVRRQGHQPAEARDLVQEFFATLLEKGWLDSADQERGRFRSFLLTVLKRFLSNESKRAGAQKRGGGHLLLSLDFETGEERFGREPADNWTAEKLYQRRWALTLLDHVLQRLEADYEAKGKAELFAHLKVFLAATTNVPSYADIAIALNMSEGAVKVAVHRLRERYRNLLRSEIANTVASDEEVDEELSLLLDAVCAN